MYGGVARFGAKLRGNWPFIAVPSLMVKGVFFNLVTKIENNGTVVVCMMIFVIITCTLLLMYIHCSSTIWQRVSGAKLYLPTRIFRNFRELLLQSKNNVILPKQKINVGCMHLLKIYII